MTKTQINKQNKQYPRRKQRIEIEPNHLQYLKRQAETFHTKKTNIITDALDFIISKHENTFINYLLDKYPQPNMTPRPDGKEDIIQAMQNMTDPDKLSKLLPPELIKHLSPEEQKLFANIAAKTTENITRPVFRKKQ